MDAGEGVSDGNPKGFGDAMLLEHRHCPLLLAEELFLGTRPFLGYEAASPELRGSAVSEPGFRAHPVGSLHLRSSVVWWSVLP